MKRPLYLAAIVAALSVLAALWFFDTFEQVESQVWTGPSAAARANPYLAAMRFMEKMGQSASTSTRPSELDHMPSNASLILPARRAIVTVERAQTLARWAVSGGHLIVEPEQLRHRDALLDHLGIGRAPAKPVKPAPTMTIELPDLDHALQVTSSHRDTLDVARVKADLVIADSAGVRIASFRHGTGRVSIVTGFQRFGNRAIGAHDNAELLWRILQLAPANQQVVIAQPPHESTVWQWLQDHAMQTLVTLAAILGLWLWRVVPRFGVLRPVAEPQRRQLLEHIRACGRFRWASGARASLLEAAREICQARIARQHPRLGVLSKEQYYRELAVELSMSADETARSFEATPQNAREFVHTVSVLASIHGALSRIGRAPKRSRRRP